VVGDARIEAVIERSIAGELASTGGVCEHPGRRGDEELIVRPVARMPLYHHRTSRTH